VVYSPLTIVLLPLRFPAMYASSIGFISSLTLKYRNELFQCMILKHRTWVALQTRKPNEYAHVTFIHTRTCASPHKHTQACKIHMSCLLYTHKRSLKLATAMPPPSSNWSGYVKRRYNNIVVYTYDVFTRRWRCKQFQ